MWHCWGFQKAKDSGRRPCELEDRVLVKTQASPSQPGTGWEAQSEQERGLGGALRSPHIQGESQNLSPETHTTTDTEFQELPAQTLNLWHRVPEQILLDEWPRAGRKGLQGQLQAQTILRTEQGTFLGFVRKHT